MTPPVLLSTPTPLGTDADRAARSTPLPSLALGIIAPTTRPPRGQAQDHEPGPPLPLPLPHAPESDTARQGTTGDRVRVARRARQWTGAPIRAIVPLPRRMLVSGPSCPAPAKHVVHFWHDAADATDSDSDSEEGEDSDSSWLRYCSYESISAAEGLSAWSFEELRVECYAQSLVARGTKPPPANQPSLAIPPAFVPRIVPHS